MDNMVNMMSNVGIEALLLLINKIIKKYVPNTMICETTKVTCTIVVFALPINTMKNNIVKANIAVRKISPPSKFPVATDGLLVANIPTNELMNSGSDETKATIVPAINAPENLVRFPTASTMCESKYDATVIKQAKMTKNT
jgi:hypothetical protein